MGGDLRKAHPLTCAGKATRRSRPRPRRSGSSSPELWRPRGLTTLEQRRLCTMPTEIQHFIGGKFVPGKSGRTSPVFNPATGEQQGTVPLASAAEVDEAVDIAKTAVPPPGKTPPLRPPRHPHPP